MNYEEEYNRLVKAVDAYRNDLLDEKDLLEKHIVEIVDKKDLSVTTITAAKILTVREIRDRLGVSEIKA